MTEYLFRNEDLIDEVIDTAIEDNTFRSDDLEFTFAARVSRPQWIAISFFAIGLPIVGIWSNLTITIMMNQASS